MDADTVITLPKGVLESARMSAEEAKRELALNLHAKGRLSVGKTRELAKMSLWVVPLAARPPQRLTLLRRYRP